MSTSGSFIDNRRKLVLQAAAHELEWRRCKDDERYFFSKYAWVMSSAPEHQPEGRTLFDLWDFQEEAFEAFDRDPLVVVAKSRQLGLTTLAMLDTFWRGFFQDGRYEVLIISKDQDAADTNLRMLSAVYQFLPEWMKSRGPERVDDASTKVTFRKPDGSVFRVVSLPGTATRGAGTTPNRIVADEYALMDKQDDVARVLSPAIKAATSGEVTNGSAMITISTPRGNKNRFANTFTQAWDNPEQSPWKALYFPVTCNKFLASVGESDATPKERAEAAHRIDNNEGRPGDDVLAAEFWEAWNQEYREFKHKPHLFFSEWSRTAKEAFQSSANRRFSILPPADDAADFPFHGQMLGDVSMADDARPARFDMFEPDSIEAATADWHFRYTDAEITQKFLDREVVVAVDPAQGVGGDDTAITVIADYLHDDGARGVEMLAAFWSNQARPAEVARQVFLAAKKFAPQGQRTAIVAVERPNAEAGDGKIIDQLRASGFPVQRLYRHRTEGRVRNRGANAFGMPMNKATKPKVLGDLETLFVREQADKEEVRSLMHGLFPELLQQLDTYLVLSGPGQPIRTGADNGCHDDLVMSTAIGVSVLFDARTKYRKPASTSTQSTEMTTASTSPLSVKNLMNAQRRRAPAKTSDSRLDRRADALYGRLK